MNFKTMKLICITLLMIAIIIIPISSQAVGEIINPVKEFIEAGKGQDPIFNENILETISDFIYKTLLAIAVIVAIGWGSFIGIQLMAQGAEGKANMKEALLPYVIGCIAAFSAFGIWKLVVNILQDSGI